jgi:hypothetical protein
MSFSSWIRSYKSALSRTALAKPALRGATRSRTRRLELEALEDRVVPSVTLLENFPNIDIHQTVLVTPPDTQMAVGLNTVVGAVNRAITLTDKTGGARVGPIQTNTFFSPIGNPTGRYGDPQVIYDDQAGRFYICGIERNPVDTLSTIDFAVSKTNSPATLTTADWTFFPRIASMNEGGTEFPDFPKMGWNNDAVFVSTNQFSSTSPGIFDHNLILSISKASILAGGPLDTQQTVVNTGSDRNILIPARMHNEATGNLEYFVQDSVGGDSSTTVNVVAESSYLSGPGTFTTTALTVNAYSNSPGVPGLVLPGWIDDRLLSADWVNNGTTQHLVASGNVGVGGVNLARWYEFNAPAAGAPSLLQQGDINPGGGISTSYPSVAINPNDAIAMTFLETGGGQSTSMYVTGRVSTDPLNAMQDLTLVRAGSQPIANALRGGDYSATEYDPAAPDTFWSANEFQLEDVSQNLFWGTQIAQFSVTALTPTVSLTAANATYTCSAYNTANLITLVTPAAASGSVSYMFYSDAAGQNAIATPINAGAYYVQAFFASTSSGYTNATSSIVSFNIAKANASFNVTAYSGAYDGSSHNITVVATGIGSDGNLSNLVTLGPSKTDAGSYSGEWSFSGNGNYNPANGAAAITITAKSLTVDATTQGTLNIAKAGTISFALQITAGLVSSNTNVAALFNGAIFTIVVEGTSYSLTSTATVASDGTINVSMQMSQGLQNALLTALSEGKTVDFSLSALSNDNDYSIDADAFSRLINQGKLKFAVV